MAKALSPIRIARFNLENVDAPGTENLGIDFQLGIRQGIRLYRAEFGIGEMAFVDAAAAAQRCVCLMSLHAETGNLEDLFPTDTGLINSEVVASAIIQGQMHDSAAAGGMVDYVWLKEGTINYREVLGEPLLLAQNLTFRVTAEELVSATLQVLDAHVQLWYDYVELTPAELASQFILRR
ncbi:hypothetical protein LCGC14_1982820 [marine sediment metagenome]|uniref:Uncharacterized protein n=1 Tax=marine sediment metagenome TaxID=412755 RepID=A0A0F9F8A8_9ZZZZ